MARRGREREFLIEMTRIGKYVRVCAIDTVTGIEVVTVGDPSQGETALKRTAARKLQYVLDKKRREAKEAARGDGRTDIEV